MKYNFYNKIKTSTIERQVEDSYNEVISMYCKDVDGKPVAFSYPYNCDGLIEGVTPNGRALKMLMEYKFDMDMSNRVVRAKVITQTLFYIKRFELDGEKLPKVIFIGDINECFVFHTNDIIKYLDKDINWNVAPSGAAEKNPDLVLEISEDENINPFIFEINDGFSFDSVYDKICDLTDNVKRYVHITEHNISKIFDYFTSRVIKNKSKISANDIVAIFMGVIMDGDDYFVHPKKKNILTTPFGEVQIDGMQYNSFIEHFKRKYSPVEKMRFTEISDRLIEDTNRRNKGEFYTPTLFVDYAHKMITEQLGENWKDEYVVWDNCCGTKNLTRDYRFKELYCSTLEDAELQISNKYNPEATSFKFDFLNDWLEELPKGLLEAFEQNKKIVFFLNPPYVRNSGIGNDGQVCFTSVLEDMNFNKVGPCSANLYCQFLWRLKDIKEKFNLTNCYIAIFSPTLFLCGESYKNFRMYFLNNFNLKDAIQFGAGHFVDVASSWGISFSLWGVGKSVNFNEFKYKIVDNIDGDIRVIKNKVIYNADNSKTASIWVREETKGLKTYDCPNFTSGIGIKYERGSRKGMLVNNALGYYYCNSNNVEKNVSNCGLFSSAFSSGIGVSVIKENFYKCISFFTARKLIDNNWINSKDEYLAPNESHPIFDEFVNDSIVYSLFHSASNQSSLRNISYHNKLWDIKNEFFWMSKTEVEDLANTHNNDDCYSDVHTAPERFVYQKLQTITLSPEAQVVYDKACEIVRKTFKYRPLFDAEHPEYQINNWDCGWYQIKALAKEYAKDDLDEFKELYKKLTNKMRPMVYELGFLRE